MRFKLSIGNLQNIRLGDYCIAREREREKDYSGLLKMIMDGTVDRGVGMLKYNLES